MEDEIEILRRNALSSISAKGSSYRVDSLFDRPELRRKHERPRRVTPDITREVMGAFGIKPKNSRQYVKDGKPKARGGQRHRSATSSPSHSGSRTYSSYSSSSQSRSRSSSSSSDRSSYSSSGSGSSRSPSPRNGPRTPPQRTSRKVARRPVPRSSSDRILEYHQRKKPRYTEDVSPPHDFHHYDYRRISRGAQESNPRRRPDPREEPTTHHSLSNRRGYPLSSESHHHPPRYHNDRYKESRPSYPPPFAHHSPPPRSRFPQDRGRPMGRHDKNHSHRREVPIEHTSPSKLRNKSRYHEEEDRDILRREEDRHLFRREEDRDMFRRTNEKVRRIESPDRSQVHKHKNNLERSNKDRYIVVEDSYAEESHSSKKAKKLSKDREGTGKRTRNKSPSSPHTIPEKLPAEPEIETDVQPSTNVDDIDVHATEPVDNTADLDSFPVKAGGDGSFVEELDYNEDMDNLDLHPTEQLEGGAEEVVSDVSPPRGEASQTLSDEDLRKESDGSNETIGSSVKARPISSPLRVSPERSDGRGNSWSAHGRVPVKQRLYISRQKIEEKKRSARYEDHKSSSELRPSLANRLGPPQSHHSKRGIQPGIRRRHRSDGPVKGSAMAIAEAFRKKRAAEKKGVHIHLRRKHDQSSTMEQQSTRTK